MGARATPPPYKRTGLVHRLKDLFTKLARKLGFSDNVITHSEIANVVKRMRENALQGKHESKTKAPTEDIGGRYSLDHPIYKNLPKGTKVGDGKDIGKLYQDVVDKKIPGNVKKAIRFQIVDKAEAQKLKEKTGLDLEGYKHTVDTFGINHIQKNHGNEKTEASRGQRAVTKTDIEKIPDIINNYDDVTPMGTDAYGNSVLRYQKQFKDKIYYTEVVRNKRKELVSQSLWVNPHVKESTKAPFLTSETIRGITHKKTDSDSKIPDKNKSDKGRYRTAEPAYRQHIGPKAVDKENNYLTKLEKFITKYFDSQYALLKLEKGLDMVGSLSGYKSMNMVSNFPTIYSSFLKYGSVSYKDNWIAMDTDAMGIEGITRELGDQAEDFFNLDFFLKA